MSKVSGLKSQVALLLLVMFSLAMFAGCEQTKQLAAWAETALTATDTLVAALPPDAPQVAAYKNLRVGLAKFKDDAPKAQTPQQKLTLLVEFTALVTEFNAIVKPAVSPESREGQALAQLDKSLKSVARKLSCLLVANQAAQRRLTPAQLAAAHRAREELTAFAA